MKTLEATNQLGGLNQRLPIRQSNKCFPYSRHQQHDDDAIDSFFSSVQYRDGTTAVELIVGTKKILTNVYAIGSNSVLNISKLLQDRLHECGITINIWSENTQE